MTFTSWQFVAFVTAVFLLYYLPPLRLFQVYILIVASLIFYGAGQTELLPLLALAVFGTYIFLLLTLRDRRWLSIGIAFNLVLLAFFKYKFLFIDLVTPSFSDIGAVDFVLRLPLPIGISFFVFHNISLLVDASKRGESPPTFTEVFLYIIFFPQLVSGPITRAANFLPQIELKSITTVPFIEAAKWIIVGYFFKLFVANNLNQMTTLMDYPLYETVKASDRWLLTLLYSYQIYADFFGYSAIAIGLALLFGYRLPINFNLPYLSVSFAEFWTRWHISLSIWLRTYLYIPLGGNRRGPIRTYFNLMVVMGLGGLWHGAALSYLAWGMLHGLLLVIERPFLPLFGGLSENKIWGRTVTALRILIVFGCVSLAWIFFKLPDFGHALSFMGGMLKENAIPHPARIYRSLAFIYSLPVILQHLMPHIWRMTLWQRFEPYSYGGMAALMLVEAGPDTSFIYFQF
jgi:alginate O-acetyltransferase complex protein AlgI